MSVENPSTALERLVDRIARWLLAKRKVLTIVFALITLFGAGAMILQKNVITAGASENVHPFGAADQCGTADTGADSLNDIIGFSSRGPCDDGRIKPDLVAPGTHVSGGVFQASAVATGNGAAGACFTAGGVCAGPGVSNFWPTGGQQFYTASSGTSHSTPAIAGAAALIRQRFINASLTPPSPAMTKATLLNSARYMTGTGANDGAAHFFDSPVDLFMFLDKPASFGSTRTPAEAAAMYVADFRNGTWLPARQAVFVRDSRARGPMRGPDLPAFADTAAAQAFIAEQGGRALAFEQVDASVVTSLRDANHAHHMH